MKYDEVERKASSKGLRSLRPSFPAHGVEKCSKKRRFISPQLQAKDTLSVEALSPKHLGAQKACGKVKKHQNDQNEKKS